MYGVGKRAFGAGSRISAANMFERDSGGVEESVESVARCVGSAGAGGRRCAESSFVSSCTV